MLDALIILGTLALGCWVVPALLWKSYGPQFMAWIERAAGAVRRLRPVKYSRPHYDEQGAAVLGWRGGSQYQSVPDTYHAELPGSEDSQTGAEPEIDDEEALARHLATLQKPNGSYWLSANKIAAAVGGEREKVLAVVREVRGREVSPNERMLSVDGGKRRITWEA